MTISKIALFFIFLNFFSPAYAGVLQKPLKILFILPNFLACSATFVISQITGLIDKGHDVSIFALQKSHEKRTHPDIERYNLSERTYYRYLPEDVLSYDILYCQFFSLAKKMLPEFVRLKKLSPRKPKLIVCCRGSDGIENVVMNKGKSQHLFNYVDLFLPVCEHFKNYLLQAGCDAKKIKVHHSAIDLSIFQYKERTFLPHEEILLLSIGRLTEVKGHEYAIHAFAQLEKEFPTLRYVIIGDGSQRKKLEQLIKDYDLTNKISLLGWRSRDEVITWLNSAHIFVHPSITSSGNCQEGIPNVLMEAMTTGLSVVATHHGGIPELVQDEVSGFLVPEKSTETLFEKIRYLVLHMEHWGRIGLEGRKRIIQEHDVLKENTNLEEKFYQLIK